MTDLQDAATVARLVTEDEWDEILAIVRARLADERTGARWDLDELVCRAGAALRDVPVRQFLPVLIERRARVLLGQHDDVEPLPARPGT